MNPRQTVAITAETSLVALSVITAISLERLFTETSFLREVLIMVVASHLVAIVARRADLSMAWSTLLSCATLAILGTAVFYPDSAALVLPTTETASILGDDLREAWQVFSDDSAPVPPIRGFLVTTSVLIWYGAFLADWAAFRLRSPLEAVAPATSVFVFAALLGVDRNQVAHGVLYAAAIAGVLLAMRAERQVREEIWVDAGTARGVSTTLRVGAAAGLAAVIAGGIVAPRLPGADGQPLIDITEINEGPNTRRVVSPLADIKSTLITQSDEEIFSVRVEQGDRDYWRLMALTDFDGGRWTRSSNFDDARGPVGSDIDPSVPTNLVRQEVTTRGLGNIYMPAIFEVANVVDDGGVEFEYETATGALVVKRDSERQAELGFTYVIESAVPDYSPESLPADATQGLSGDFVDENTRLPPTCESGDDVGDGQCWPARVTDLAREVTAGATTDYQRARLLQDYFTGPGATFDYDLGVEEGGGVDNIEDFLFAVRRGYCQQFASTFAAMARSLGIPARVAVGFTPGEWSAARQEFIVRGHHAHAWPEVYFAGVGWVIFDPTPGRGRPHDADITGLAEQQFPDNALAETDVTPTTLPAEDGGTTPNTQAPFGEQGPAPQEPIPEGDAAVAEPAGGGVAPAVWVILAVIGGAGLMVATIPAIRVLRRRRRLHRVAADPVGRGELAWDDALDALRLVGHRPSRHHTPLEFAGTVEQARRPLGPIATLAEEVTVLRYAEPGNGVEHAIAAQRAAAAVVERCHTVAGRRAVVTAAVDPRTLVSGR